VEEDMVLRDGVSLDGQLDPRAIDEAREEGVVAPQDDAGIATVWQRET
jgi:hypothetical protein